MPYSEIMQDPAAAHAVAADVKSAGVMGAASGLAKIIYAKYEPTAKKRYTKYEPMAEQYAASEKGYNALYLPLVPTEKIAKVFTTQFVAN
ncbi:REF/SRPP-like protein At3g05500 [Solanum verrucosum]|uniref:REF/SRPP-like protein At3g05500 n=1 Tax=Solanum verrucosum TaxID=315347 RepID=UPI0020D024A3|nr:REF/SRPP-like protein At3g05500 [Solanum verrucosum]